MLGWSGTWCAVLMRRIGVIVSTNNLDEAERVAIYGSPTRPRASVHAQSLPHSPFLGRSRPLALQVGLFVSARVNDPRTAQQLGALFILPLTALFIGADVRCISPEAGRRAPLFAVLVAALVPLLFFGVKLFGWGHSGRDGSDRITRPLLNGSVTVLGDAKRQSLA